MTNPRDDDATLARVYGELVDTGYANEEDNRRHTAEDYFKFAQMMVNGGELDGRRYLAKKTVEFMLSDHIVGMGGSTMATTS